MVNIQNTLISDFYVYCGTVLNSIMTDGKYDLGSRYISLETQTLQYGHTSAKDSQPAVSWGITYWNPRRFTQCIPTT